MRNIKLTIEYDGTNYNGWQTQEDKNTIQDTVESALKVLTNEETKLVGASRTDSGVHALGQVANFMTSSNISVEKYPNALNSVLPKDIVIKKAEDVSENFHSRYDSKGKTYRYVILNSKYPSALNRNFSYFYPYYLDVKAMQEACEYIIGTHDFSAFKASGGSSKTSIRTVHKAEIIKKSENIYFYITGDGFLYNMVRIIIGTLLEVGRGKIRPKDMEYIILSRDRKRAGKTAPAHGLYLMEVLY